MKIFIIAILSSILLSTNCLSTPVAKYKMHWDHKNTTYRHWTRNAIMAVKSLGHNILTVIPKDIDNYCPKYKDLEMSARVHFWAYLLSVMAKKESNFKPESTYKENFKDRKGSYITSRGLLQISIESGLGYKCPFKTEQDIHDPAKNLKCGVMILDRWVKQDKVIAGKVSNEWRGGSRYWAVLRKGSSHEYIKKVMKTEFCSLY